MTKLLLKRRTTTHVSVCVVMVYVLASNVGSSSARKKQLTNISPTTAWSNQSRDIMRFEARRYEQTLCENFCEIPMEVPHAFLSLLLVGAAAAPPWCELV